MDEDRKQLSELNEAFKNLYVNLYDDKYVKGERELRETYKEKETEEEEENAWKKIVNSRKIVS